MLVQRGLLPAILAGALLSGLSGPGNAQKAPDFYKDKTIHLICGSGPGGGRDLYARLLAQFLRKHIPGNPSIVVEDMDGAGGVVAANYVYDLAQKDGTYIATVNQDMPMYQMLGGKGAKFDSAKLQWIGSVVHSNELVYTWTDSGIKTIDDAKQKSVALGAVGKTSDSFIYPTVMNALLGTKFAIVSGYSGTNQIDLAMQNGEVMGRGGNSWSSTLLTHADWIKDHKINILVQIGATAEKELPNVPVLVDLIQKPEDKQIAEVISLPTALGYGEWLAPEVPGDRIAILRKAFAETIKDPDFLAAGKKTDVLLAPQTGDEVQALVGQVTTIPKAVLQNTAKLLGWND